MGSSFVPVGGGELFVQEWAARPDLPAILLLHGFNQTSHSWSEVAEPLSHELRVIAPDQRGHGKSLRAEDRDYGRETMVRDAVELLDHFELPNAIVVGMSMGATHAITLAAEHPTRARGLVVVDYAPEVRKTGTDNIKNLLFQRWDSFDDAVLTVMEFNPRRSEANVRGRLEHTLAQQSDGKWTWAVDPYFVMNPRFAEPREVMWGITRAVRCPTLLVRGAESDLLTPAIAERMRGEMHDAELVDIPNAGHSVAGDNPAALETALTAFVARLGT